MSIVPSSPTDRVALKQALEEITNSMTRADAERDHIKEVIDMIKTKFEIEPKITRKMAKTMHARNFADHQTANEEFELLYESVVENMIVVPDVADDDED